jgi:hypothetical protein
MSETFQYLVRVRLRGSKPISEGPAVELDHELQVGELYAWEGHQTRVTDAWSEERDYGCVCIVEIEGPHERS